MALERMRTRLTDLKLTGVSPIVNSRTLFSVVVIAASLTLTRYATAGGGPQNVALVVNPRDTDSLTVANHYAAIRRIPDRNIIHIPWKLNAQRMSGALFVRELITPLIAEIKSRGLEKQIDCITYSCGYPYVVDASRGFGGASPTAASAQSRPQLSLNSATYLYELVMRQQRDALALNSNGYYAPPVRGRTISRAFDANQAWGPDGRPAGQGGRRYYLSTLLGVTFGRGNTVDEIVQYLSRSAAADGTRPPGTIYFMQHKNIRSKVRQPTFAAATAELKQLGVAARVVQGREPSGRLDIAGLTAGYPQVNIRSRNGRLIPGALVDNLTSAGGQLQMPSPKSKNPQTPVSQYMREGAAGASGTVIEPYAIVQKFPNAHLHVHYVRGCSLAESFYQSVQGPFQLLIVGDPLCRPWARVPDVRVSGVADGASIKGTVELQPTATVEGNAGIAQFEAFVDGQSIAECGVGEQLILDTTKLSNGWHQLRIVAKDDTPIAVQGAWYGSFEVKNDFGVVHLSLDDDAAVSSGGYLSVNLRTNNDAPTKIYHLGRVVAESETSDGKVRIKASQLGRGPATLVAVQEGEPGLRSRPITIQIK